MISFLSHRLRQRFLFGAVACGVMLGAMVAPGHAQVPVNQERVLATDEEILAALERDLGVSRQEVLQVLDAQSHGIALDARLRAELGDAYVGSVFDADAGRLRVMVSDPDAAARATNAGAEARLVEHSRAELEQIKAELDAVTGFMPSATRVRGSRAPRPPGAAGRLKDALRGVEGWFLDPESNTVRITVLPGHRATVVRHLEKYGNAVSFEAADDGVAQTTDFMDGGDAINGGSCSAGFNLRNQNTGQGFLLTAGHCVGSGSTVKGHSGHTFGKVLESWFPYYDDALVKKSNSFWTQGPWVDTNPSSGGIIHVHGHLDSVVGTTVCHSGITTKWTCGRITAKNQTVMYKGWKWVHGLTRYSACTKKGDSGGAVVTKGTFGNSAVGVASGARLYKRLVNGEWRSLCGEELDTKRQNRSWYFPIADSLAYYGPGYGVTVWTS